MGKGNSTALAFVKDEDRTNRVKPQVAFTDHLETSCGQYITYPTCDIKTFPPIFSLVKMSFVVTSQQRRNRNGKV